MQIVRALPLLVSVVSALPHYQVELPSKRQSDGVSWLCSENTCDLSGCPMSLEYGSGYPECLVYDTTESIYDNILTPDGNGQNFAFFSFPDPGPDCKFILRSPAGRSMDKCGKTLLSVGGAACQRVALSSTFMLQFCCGPGDCEAAATKRSDIFSRSASGGALYLKNTTTGEVIIPSEQGPPLVGATKHSKRDCGEFVVTEGPYTSVGESQRVSEDTGCGPVEECEATVTKTATQSRTLSVSLSVGDPWGVISASVGVDFTESSSYSSARRFPIPEGGTGYLVYTPYTICYMGHFTGDCADQGVDVEVCYPDTDADGNLKGQLSSALSIA